MRQISDFFSQSAPHSLFHYTSIESLLGIKSTGSIWASHIYFQNDSKEIVHACEVLRHAIAPRIAFGGLSAEEEGLANQLQKWVKSFHREKYCLFVFSLSEVPSLLSQWRSYTPHGKGVSLEFGSALLDILIRDNSLRIAKCMYEEHEHREILTSLFEKLLTSFRQKVQLDTWESETVENQHFQFFESFRGDVLQVLSLIKHESFREEREWRLISQYFPSYAIPQIKFRSGSSLLVPYLEIPIAVRSPVFDSIILGPTPHADLSMNALAMFGTNSGLTARTVNSNIPFRKW
jgi:hypothetical protein